MDLTLTAELFSASSTQMISYLRWQGNSWKIAWFDVLLRDHLLRVRLMNALLMLNIFVKLFTTSSALLSITVTKD
jgi:hypothetical protein